MLEPWHWLVLGFVLLIVEMFVPTFASLWFGAAAIIVAALLWLIPIPVSVQIIIWLVLSAIFLVAWFKFIKPLSTDKTKAGLSREATIGQIGMVIQTNLEHDQIKVRFPMPVLGSDEWNCRTTSPVQVGDRIRVIDILGNDLVVQPHHSAHDNEKVRN